MSHYAILITNTDKIDVDEQLAPFDENGGESGQYLQFDVEIEKGAVRDFANQQVKKFEKYLEDPKGGNGGFWQKQVRLYKDALAKSDEELFQFIKDQEDFKEQDGALGYMRNMNAKWDWYSIGGRWDNDLKLKSGKFANIARKKDIDPEHLADPYFAILHNGEWYQKGEMLYFAMVADEKSEEGWKKEWDEILAEVDDNAEITLVDIHI